MEPVDIFAVDFHGHHSTDLLVGPPPPCYVGIDPGFTGYISVLNYKGNLITWVKTPIIVDVKKTKKRKTGKISTKTKTTLDEEKIIAILKHLGPNVVICVEKQHAVTGQGLASTAKTMYGFGFWVGAARALGMELHLIGAKEWQNDLLDLEPYDIEDKDITKKASVAAVKEWNKELDLRKTKRSKIDDHNLADSLNIGRYAYRKFGPQQ
jgi:hypothetical protein